MAICQCFIGYISEAINMKIVYLIAVLLLSILTSYADVPIPSTKAQVESFWKSEEVLAKGRVDSFDMFNNYLVCMFDYANTDSSISSILKFMYLSSSHAACSEYMQELLVDKFLRKPIQMSRIYSSQSDKMRLFIISNFELTPKDSIIKIIKFTPNGEFKEEMKKYYAPIFQKKKK